VETKSHKTKSSPIPEPTKISTIQKVSYFAILTHKNLKEPQKIGEILLFFKTVFYAC